MSVLCTLFFFFISLNSTSVWFSGLLVVFPGQRGFPSSLCGGVGCCCFMMKGFSAGIFYGVLYKALPY